MRTRRLSTVLVAVSIPLLAGGAIAVASSVSTQPGPQVIIPSRTSSESAVHEREHGTATPSSGTGSATSTTGADDHGHDGVTTPHPVTTAPKVSDDPAGHDAGDDRGTDEIDHDGTDVDRTGSSTTTSTGPKPAPTPPTTVTTTPGHGGDDGPGHDPGGDHGPGHGGGGSDDSGGHGGTSGPGH